MRSLRTASLGPLLLLVATVPLSSVGCGGDVTAEDRSGKTAYEGNQWAVVRPGEQASYDQRQTLLHRGQQVYALYCAGCHGDYGDGKGPAAERLITQPRDFQSGIYKFRSTDSNSLPLETDLHRTITRGLSRVSMPAFPLMSEHDKTAVVQYIKAFYPSWEEEAPQRRIVPVPQAPADLASADRATRGELVYRVAGCASCHGSDGAGQGATRVAYVDAWGHPQRPFNFTLGSLKGGDDPEDIYRTFRTGLRSIMPEYGKDTFLPITQEILGGLVGEEELARFSDPLSSFPETNEAVESLAPEQQEELIQRNAWDLVAYVLSLRS